MTRKVWR